MRGEIQLLELDLAAEHLLLPGLMLSFLAVEFRHHFLGEQLERLADVLMLVLARLVEQDDAVDV